MKQFFKFTLATVLGVIIASFLSVLLFFGIVGAIAGSSEKVTEVKENSVYELELKGVLNERSEDNPFRSAFAGAMGSSVTDAIGLDDILQNIKKAKENDKIKGIYLKGCELMGGYASFKEIRDALVDFKKSGKFIIAYADVYAQRDYYLASVANKVLINPEGMLELKGLSAELMFFKGTLDKLGIEMQVVKVGTYKSAVEPYITTQMSDANREQVTVFLNSIWKNMTKVIAADRKISVDQLNLYADELMTFQEATKYKQYHLVDSLVYADEVDSIISKYVKDYNLIKHADMVNVPADTKFEKDKVGVIYAVGAIDGGEQEGIDSEDLVKTIGEVTADSSVKAVVLRVNSPGGSAYGSEQIWRALSLLKAKKPLIVSMGDYAASGGYYISCMGTQIVAQPTTITGSIGIFGLIPNIDGLNKKIGLTYDGVKTNKMGDAMSLNRQFRPEERELMQNYVNRGYELFVKRCADGRKMKTDSIKAIAEGRVWTGEDALKKGLVDKLGGLSDAVKLAAEKAKLKNYMIKDFPAKEDFITKLMKEFNTGVSARIMKSQLGNDYMLFKKIQEVRGMSGIQARIPYEFDIK